MSLLLDWANVTVTTTTDLLWYLTVSPPPGGGAQPVPQPALKTQVPQTEGTSPAPQPVAPGGDVQPNFPSPQSAQDLAADQPQPTAAEAEVPPPPPVVTTTEPQPPSLFALTIGINDYKHVIPLSGCVADADDMVTFLQDTLGVPAKNITNLRNEDATREAIEGAIAALANDVRIQKDDPIVIFYAGHGAEAPAPPGWSSYGKIQMLVPVDFIPEATGDKKRGQGVIDVQIGHLLEELAKKKGNNITVIFDCCHSGTGTRDDEADPSHVSRGFELDQKKYQIAQGLLDDIPKRRATGIAEGFQTSGLLSHVLLAACKKEQTAKERQGRGAFTQALLELWRSESVDLMTYKDSILRMPDLPLQNPQCEGVNQNRVLFNSRAVVPRPLYEVTCKNANLFQLNAGDAHGVNVEAEFTINSDRTLRTPLGKTVVRKTNAFQADLVPADGQDPFTFEATAYAIQTRIGKGEDVKFLLPLDERLIPIFIKIRDEMQKNDADKRGIALVDDESEKPNLKMFLTKNEKDQDVAAFEVMDPLCRQYGFTQMPCTSKLETKFLYPVLRSAADFYYNLNRSSNQSIIATKVRVSCFRLKETDEFDDDLQAILEPDMDLGDLNVGGMITVPSSDEYKYGFLVKNTSAVPLFLSLFYFDMSDLSVSSFYEPSTAKGGETDVSIPPNGEIKIGYGDSGTVARDFFLRKGQTCDVSYLKLFLSTAYVDFSRVAQLTPFDHDRAVGESKPKVRLIWDTMKIAVVTKSELP